MKYLPAALLLLVLPLAAGCGAASPDAPDVASAGTTAKTTTTTAAASKKNTPKDAEAAMLAHARCMRAHGVNVPDPKPGGGELVKIDDSVDPETVDAAMKACQSLVEDAGLKPTPEEMEKQFASALKFAKCMREHGIDMPDPQREGDGIKMTIGGPGSSVDPTRMDAAQQACAKDAPFGNGPPPSSLKPGEGVVNPAAGPAK